MYRWVSLKRLGRERERAGEGDTEWVTALTSLPKTPFSSVAFQCRLPLAAYHLPLGVVGTWLRVVFLVKCGFYYALTPFFLLYFVFFFLQRRQIFAYGIWVGLWQEDKNEVECVRVCVCVCVWNVWQAPDLNIPIHAINCCFSALFL